MTRKTVTALVLLTIVAAAVCTPLQAQSTAPSKPPAPPRAAAPSANPLTNADIVQLVKLGIPADAIVKKIKSSESSFDTSSSAVAALRKDAVPDAVIIEMVLATKNTATNAVAAPPGPPGAQASSPQASSPRLQQAQTAASAPPPPTQSETEGSPACSSGRPILKRGKQPDLPPCPDPPPDAPPPANSVPTRSLSPAESPTESLIERAREAAFEFSEKLPNFICQEFMSRFAQRGREGEMPLDVVSAEIIYDNAQESYRNVKINDRPTDKGMEEIGGSWSTGEFASTLLGLFHPDTRAQFQSGGASAISGFSAQVYDFQVRSENSRWMVRSGSQSLAAAYGGSVWVDPKTARVLRIEIQARNIPADFPMDTVESSVDYSYVTIGDTSFLLPVHAESLGCERGTSYCSHNIIDFRNYHEYTSSIKIGP